MPIVKNMKGPQTMNNNKEFLATEPIGKLLIRLAVPTVAAQMINMLYNIVDRIYIGHIPGNGSLALTGVGVCMPLIMIISALQRLSETEVLRVLLFSWARVIRLRLKRFLETALQPSLSYQ